MQLNITQDSVVAAGRHVVTFTGGALTMAALFHFVTPGQSNDLNGAVSQIVGGVTQISAGVATIVGIVGPLLGGLSAYFSAKSATQPSRIDAVVKNDEVAKIVMKDQASADAHPSDKVVGPSALNMERL